MSWSVLLYEEISANGDANRNSSLLESTPNKS
jgi:hypothetical protein